ncbi:hypothetical protein OKA05_28960 [Luteolibacter arcticus]|uniref:Lipopolysaccharide biosynthesis protein n=1 Tax=Luteolibacter arcticus TaxID=1581411 RepID=A0ABT3GSY6_9BACT|nr:MYXO-CTERM sorting domain-containing protein [Luteolibacter arcticus]MCW1926618.1 hypothetical protein [Luteolibacter arcticus]
MLPVLGLLAGVIWFLMQQFKETTVSGSMVYYPSRTSSMSDEERAREGIEFLTSKRVVEGTARRLSRSMTWGLSSDMNVIRSRQSVEVDSSIGLSAIELTVTGRGEKAAHEAWMAIYETAREIAAVEQVEFERTRIVVLEEEVIRLEGEVAALGLAPVVSQAPAGRPAHLLSLDKLPGSEDIGAMLSQLDASRKELKELKGLGGSQWCGTSFFEPVGLISPPHFPAPALPVGPMGMIGLCGASGFGGGLFMAVFLAYVMEWLRPRRVEPLSAIPADGPDI